MPRSSSPLPPKFKSHPIYPLRLGLLITCAIGVFLCLFSIPNMSPYETGPFIWSIILCLASIIYVLYDLFTWSLHSPTTSGRGTPPSLPNPSITLSHARDPKEWPRLTLLIWDAIFAVVFHWTFWVVLRVATYGGYQPSSNLIFQAWAALAIFVCSLLYAGSFWKELMARLKQRWEKRRVAEPCPRCGFVDGGEEGGDEGGDEREDGEGSGEGSPTAVVAALNQSIKDRLPRWMKSAKSGAGADIEAGEQVEGAEDTEESLLITPDVTGESSQNGYGGIEYDGETLTAPEECIVKKKGKTRVIWTGGDAPSSSTGGKRSELRASNNGKVIL
ncbi:hypothetical protein NA57DRAFT_60575 [Rhizodiscina lignyota]|uniref:Uncharacterized protein n=1 Tax=Rhizodiscina lignyota TaxID=1504668 RepID=A0A9P4M1F0_9PEZI|nr:hypothetical protein NA57DRAFT_60575 [Rhizodiscina lignyota]